MSRVGLVLGGGGVTGAAYEIAALMAIEKATGWNPDKAEVVVGTSSGAFVTALVRHDALNLDSLVQRGDDRQAVADRIRAHVYAKGPRVGLRRWIRHGLAPGLLRPGLTLFLGSPAPYHALGIAEWVSTHIGPEAATRWPVKPTAIVAHDLEAKARTAFGTAGAPDAGISDAVAASSAVPLIFRPYAIESRLYVDGGVSSGTHADLVLGAPRPLDLLLVIAPLASEVSRKRARLHERVLDRVGTRSLDAELRLVEEAWPSCDIVVLTPSPSVQNASRPNPMDPNRAVATFMRTLITMKRTLARRDIWGPLAEHLRVSSERAVRE
ncbi:MAG: patatin-like phospholipase family protein [Acidimicrobiia bacterium]